MNIFLTSDTHFGHNKPFLYEPRGFASIEEMNEAVIERWNSIVNENDLVYHLGDVYLNDYDVSQLKRLHGNIILIRGNHDTDRKISDIYATGKLATNNIHTSELIKFGKLSLFLCHYPVLTANYDEKHFSQHTLSIHGHTHLPDKFDDSHNPFLYNVCLDAHNCYPVPIEQVVSDMRNQFIKFTS